MTISDSSRQGGSARYSCRMVEPPFEATIPKGVVGRAKASLSVLGRQAGAVRKR